MSTQFFDETPMFLLDHATMQIIDVNSSAVEFYGISRADFRDMNMNDLGDWFPRKKLVKTNGSSDNGSDKIWRQQDATGELRFVQYTYQMLNHKGKPARLAVVHDVTELINNKVANKQHYPRVPSYLSNSPLAAIEWTRDFEVKNWSEGAEEFFGWTGKEVVGKKAFFRDFIHPAEFKTALDNRDRALKQSKVNYTVEGRNITKNGEIMHCEWYNSLLYDDEGNLVSIFSLVNDVTERKQSEYLFKALSEESIVGVYLIQDGVFKYINPQFARIFKYREEEILHNLSPIDLTHPEDRAGMQEYLEKRMTGEITETENDFRGVTKDGRQIHLNTYGTRIFYNGAPAIIGTLVDVTERKETLARYKASVKSFEDLFDSISDAIFIQNEQGEFIDVNQGAVEMFGYDRQYLKGRHFQCLAAPGKVDLDDVQLKFSKALQGQEQMLETWGKRKNGEIFPKEVALAPGTFFGEKVVIAIARDISERYESERRIRLNEERFRQLFDTAPIGIVMMNRYQEVQDCNSTFEEMFGLPAGELKGLDIDQIIVPEEFMEEAEGISSQMFAGQAAVTVSKRQRKDGSLIDVMIYGVPVVIDGQTESIFGIYVDITDRKEAEEQIKKSLREKEVLLAEIHHRVKNNLAVITGLLELQGYNTTSEEASTVLQESQMRINSIALIHEKLYQSKDLSRISFDLYIRELVDLIVNLLIDEDRDVDINIDAEPIQLTINQAIPCGLILNELITNAYKHAFEPGESGKIDIELSRKNGEIVLSITDNGKGIPSDLDLEESKTLGLTLIRTLCQQLHGNCNFENPVQNGTTFTLSFSPSE